MATKKITDQLIFNLNILKNKKLIDDEMINIILPDLEENLQTRKRRFSVFDLETNNKDASLQSWGFLNETLKFEYGISWNDFNQKIESFSNLENKIFGQNNAKFDNHFLISFLEKNGWKNLLPFPEGENLEIKNNAEVLINYWWKRTLYFFKTHEIDINFINEYKDIITDIKDKDEKMYLMNKFISESVFYKKYMVQPKFNDKKIYKMITNNNFVNYELKLTNSNYVVQNFNNKKFKKFSKLTFWDANLIFAGSIKKKAEALNKMYNTNVFTKLYKNYNQDKIYKTVKEFENDGEELKYLFYDNLILLIFLINIDKFFNRKNWKMTSASTAYANWKYQFFGQEKLNDLINSGVILKRTMKNGMKVFQWKDTKTNIWSSSKSIKDQIINYFFPVDQKNFNDLYKWYTGGLSGSNPKTRGIKIDDTVKIDIVSNFPSVMNSKRWYCVKKLHDDGNERGINFYEVEVKKDIKNTSGLSWIQIPNKDGNWNYADTINKGQVLYLNSGNIEQFKKYYDWTKDKTDIRIVYSFSAVDGKWIYGSFVDYWFKIKKEAKENGNVIIALIAKMMLNSRYGKDGTKRERESRIYFNQEWARISSVTDQEYYLPNAILTTTYGRMNLVDTAQNYGKWIIQYDTDSFILIKELLNVINLKIGKELGNWELEGEGYAIGRRAKQYKFNDEVKFASLFLSEDLQKSITNKEFVEGKIIPNQTRPKRLPTGISIEEYDKSLNEIYHKDYIKRDKGIGCWYQSKDDYFSKYEEVNNEFLKQRKEVFK